MNNFRWFDNHYHLRVCAFCGCVMHLYSTICKCKQFQKHLRKQGNKIIRNLIANPDEDYFGFKPGKHHRLRLGL